MRTALKPDAVLPPGSTRVERRTTTAAIERDTVQRVLKARAEAIVVAAQMDEIDGLCQKASFDDTVAHCVAMTIAGTNQRRYEEMSHYYMLGKLAKGRLLDALTDRFCGGR